MAQRKPRSRVVFVSSTSEDLKEHREAARDAAISAGFLPVLMEYFPSGKKPPLTACLAKVDEADVVVAIVGHRYGWVPRDQGGHDHKSITWLECEHAGNEGKEVMAFLVNETHDWPVQSREAYTLLEAIENGTLTPELTAEVQRNVAKLGEFKDWLKSRGIRATFTTPEDLRGKVEAALRESKSKPTRTRKRPRMKRPRQDDPREYLQFLREETAYIDVRGLGVGSGKAHSFPIEDLYIPLTTATIERRHEKSETDELHLELRAKVELHEALTNKRLVIIGDPGSGKTTFLRRIAFALCQAWLKEDPQAAESRLGIRDQPFPIFISVGKLIEHIRNAQHSGSRDAPTTKDSAAWLPHYLATASQELSWELSAAFFTEKLKEGSCMLLLDGLDEAPNRRDRESVARLLEQARKAYGKCRFVVTSRPLAYSGKAVLTDFPQVQIEPLENEAIETFLQRWSEGLFPESPKRSRNHCAELLEALRHLPEVRRMAHNPVMLTALAVVHWNERQLPEQLADLHESIITWLLRSREQRPGRASADRTFTLLGHLALAMQSYSKGRQVRVSKGWAAEAIAPQFREVAEADRLQIAKQFLDEEEVDSGVIVSRGSEVRFGNLAFQEYLAARAIAGQSEAAQWKHLRTKDRIYKPEWREVVLLLAGVLLVKQGVEKVDGLFTNVLDKLGKKPSLADRARCVGLLGAIVRDLKALNYRPTDPRYASTLDSVLGIFDPIKSRRISIELRIAAAEALGQAGDPRLAENNWVSIPTCQFSMGAQSKNPAESNYDPEASENEAPVHEVHLDAYQIGRYPVTVQEYRIFMNDDGYQNTTWWKFGGFSAKSQPNQWEEQQLYPNRPVVGITWYEAAAYCAWVAGRLPTEAEWERAARGTEGRRYPWGDMEPTENNSGYAGSTFTAASPVGIHPLGATLEEIHDLSGKIQQWVADYYDASYYRASPIRNPPGPRSGHQRIIRGGISDHGNGSARVARNAARQQAEATASSHLIGFRCARELEAVPLPWKTASLRMEAEAAGAPDLRLGAVEAFLKSAGAAVTLAGPRLLSANQRTTQISGSSPRMR